MNQTFSMNKVKVKVIFYLYGTHVYEIEAETTVEALRQANEMLLDYDDFYVL